MKLKLAKMFGLVAISTSVIYITLCAATCTFIISKDPTAVGFKDTKFRYEGHVVTAFGHSRIGGVIFGDGPRYSTQTYSGNGFVEFESDGKIVRKNGRDLTLHIPLDRSVVSISLR